MDTERHRIAYIGGTGHRLVVSMSGVGNRRRFFPPWEFIGTASDNGRNHVLLVSERARSWMNSPGFAEAIAEQIEMVVDAEKISEVVALGNSMGGFMALVLPQYTNVDRVVAISAQFSMHSDIAPEDNRWPYWRARMGDFRHKTIGELDPDARDYFLLHGATKNENLHWGRFPYDPKLSHYILQGKGHGLVVAMKGSGLMNDVLKQAIDGQSDRAAQILSTKFKPVRRDQLSDDMKYLW